MLTEEDNLLISLKDLGGVDFVRTPRYGLTMTLAMLALTFASVTQTLDLPPGALSAICWVESRHTPSALHPMDGNSDSIGICQIKLETGRLLGYKGTAAQLSDPTINILWAGYYLKKQLVRYDGDVVKAIAAYNAGKHRVNARGEIMNRKYVGKVMKAWGEGR
jgi:soluble lytic murein transglycosylase-like protein